MHQTNVIFVQINYICLVICVLWGSECNLTFLRKWNTLLSGQWLCLPEWSTRLMLWSEQEGMKGLCLGRNQLSVLLIYPVHCHPCHPFQDLDGSRLSYSIKIFSSRLRESGLWLTYIIPLCLRPILLLNLTQASLFPSQTICLACWSLNLFANFAAHCRHISYLSFGLCLLFHQGFTQSWGHSFLA